MYSTYTALLAHVACAFQEPGSAIDQTVHGLPEPRFPVRLQIDESRIVAQGIRITRGRHLALYTDVRDRKDVDELVPVFGQAVDEWCRYFSIDPKTAAPWYLDTSVILDQRRFEAAGLFPANLPEFLAGFQRDGQTWTYLQEGDYYTRHLFLHEGTHAFMSHFLGGPGPPWYSEGMAELVALNRWHDGRLELAYPIKHRDEVPYWGRIRLLQEAVANRQVRSLGDVMNIEATAFRQVESYAWAWAACEFLSKHPLSAGAFADLPALARLNPILFNQRLRQKLEPHWSQLEFEWCLFLSEIDYGSDVARSAIRAIQPKSTTIAGARTYTIDASGGWQKSDIRLRSGQIVELKAAGMFQIADDGEPWECSPDGVTIEYYRGAPLGRLMIAIIPEDLAADPRQTLEWHDAGSHAWLQAPRGGWLAFRVNESPAHWSDNSGSLDVVVAVE